MILGPSLFPLENYSLPLFAPDTSFSAAALLLDVRLPVGCLWFPEQLQVHSWCWTWLVSDSLPLLIVRAFLTLVAPNSWPLFLHLGELPSSFETNFLFKLSFPWFSVESCLLRLRPVRGDCFVGESIVSRTEVAEFNVRSGQVCADCFLRTECWRCGCFFVDVTDSFRVLPSISSIASVSFSLSVTVLLNNEVSTKMADFLWLPGLLTFKSVPEKCSLSLKILLFKLGKQFLLPVLFSSATCPNANVDLLVPKFLVFLLSWLTQHSSWVFGEVEASISGSGAGWEYLTLGELVLSFLFVCGLFLSQSDIDECLRAGVLGVTGDDVTDAGLISCLLDMSLFWRGGVEQPVGGSPFLTGGRFSFTVKMREIRVIVFFLIKKTEG